MNQDTDNSTADHDVDLADLEDRLYAQVHYEIGDNESVPPPSVDANEKNARKQRDPKFDDKLRSVSAHCMVKNSSVASSEKNGGRYWAGSGIVRPSSPKPPYSKKEYHNALAALVSARNGSKNANNSTAAIAAPSTSKQQNSNPIVPSSNKPKVFTPYKPLLLDAGVFPSTSNNDPIADTSESREPCDSEPDTTATGLKETSKLIKNRQKNSTASNQTKRKNPFAKPSVAAKKEEKRLNPFHHMRQENLKVKDKLESKKRKNKVTPPSKPVAVDDDEDDDDVIILPTEPPPLICIDSSDDEAHQSKRRRTTADPGTSKQLLGRIPGNSRCTSPTNSILSADDFILQTDRRRVENEVFCGVSGDDLFDVNRTVDRILRRTDGITNIVPDSINEANDAVVFATPLRKKKEKKPKEPAKSYEMTANSFAAVDVYESESSDMPDTIYAKGLTGRRKKASSSSSSEVSDVSVDVPKSKRLKKRKSSGSAKGSDFPSTDESSSENDLDDGTVADSIPYLIRGEALGKVKKSSSRKAKKNLKRKRQQSDKLSDEEFISKLTSIVQGDNDASNDDEIDESRETSNDSIAARDIVTAVLQKRCKRSKKANAADDEQPQVVSEEQPQEEVEETNVESAERSETIVTPPEETDESGENEKALSGHESEADGDQQGMWIVKDQVGEIDGNEADDDQNLLNISTSPIDTANIENEGPDDNNESIEEVTPCGNVPKPMAAPANDSSDLFVFGEHNASAENLEMAWNEEMKCFYNKSWGGEAFKLGRIQARMSRNFTEWAVANSDKFPPRGPNRNRQNSRCVNCHERGHRVHDCPQPAKKVVCYMCGQEGHFEPRCPNKICLKCGQRARAFKFGCEKCEQEAQMQCFVCRLRGHKAVECPDKWRRYHSTTEPAIPLTENEKLSPEKVKYCSVCAKRGHLAENCRSASRLMDRPVNSLNIRSYRDAYNTQPIERKESQPMYAIFSDKVEDFDFRFGKTVSGQGNTIYGRFAQAVGLKRKKLIAKSRKPGPSAALSTITRTEAMPTAPDAVNKTEPTHHFFNEEDETPVEVEKDVSEGTEVLVTTEGNAEQDASAITASDSCEIVAVTEQPADARFNQAKNLETTGTEASEGSQLDLVTGASEISDTSMNVVDESTDFAETSIQSVDTERKLKQLKAYDSNMKQLAELKEQLIEQHRIQTIVKNMEKTTATTHAADSTANCDSDSNYSFSEYYVANAARKQAKHRDEPSTSAAVILPDFIPLSAGQGAEERFKEAPSPPETVASNSRSEAKVFLSSDHCKYLLTPTGHNFLKDKEVKHDVVIRLEWSNFGNVLAITGTAHNQEEFRTDLIEFFETLDRKIKSRSEVQIPKNRVQLIKHVSSIIRELTSMNTNNVLEFYHSMRRYEKPNTKASNRKAERCRRFLNMALFGVFGFRDGHKHLQALQESLRQLRCRRDTNIPVHFRQTINEHLNYIFSAQPHENYADLIELYTVKKRLKALPELNLDRKLLGLPIDVQPNRNAATTSNDVSNSSLERIDEVPVRKDPADIPSLMDLQLNVSQMLPSPPHNGSGTELLPQKIDGSDIPSVETNQYAFWSEKCLEIIEKLKIVQLYSKLKAEQLSAYERQARNHELHFTEYSRLFKYLQNAIENQNTGL